MSPKPLDPEIERAAAVSALSVAIAQAFHPADFGNDMYELLCATWIRYGRSPEWISSAMDAVEDIKGISFAKNAEQNWVLVVEWEDR